MGIKLNDEQVRVALVGMSALAGGLSTFSIITHRRNRNLEHSVRGHATALQSVADLYDRLLHICQENDLELSEFDHLSLLALYPEWVPLNGTA